jgi:hypothetical protein
MCEENIIEQSQEALRTIRAFDGDSDVVDAVAIVFGGDECTCDAAASSGAAP